MEPGDRGKDSSWEDAFILDALLVAMPDAFILYNLEGRPLRWNKSYNEFTGYSDDEIRTMNAMEFHPEENIKYVAEAFGEVVQTGNPMYIETKVLNKSGRAIPCSLSGSLLKDADGKPVGLLGVGRDITERKRIEEELRKHRENLEELVERRTTDLAEANRQLEERIAEKEEAEEELLKLNRELDAYAHTVSHELRNPLSGIYLAVEWLERLAGESGEEQIRPEIERVARQVKENVERTEEHIKRLLELAEAGQEPVEIREVDLKQVLEDVTATSAEYMGGNGVEVEVDDDMGRLRANPTHIHQLFSNLMDNAIKHNAGCDLLIEVSHLGDDRDGGHRYLFRDNGSGVAPENTGKIFQPFYSGTNETGIGLATVAKIVKVYGGSIRAYNDNGACFEFVIRDYQRE